MCTDPCDKPPDCKHCTHYYITHDANFRYGCRALDFKSQRQPNLDVLEASGEQCKFFIRKMQRDS